METYDGYGTRVTRPKLKGLTLSAAVVVASVGLVVSTVGVVRAAVTWGTAEPASFASGVQNAGRFALFNAVSCVSAGNCTAVGQFKNAAGGDEAFTQTSTDGMWGTAEPASFETGVQNALPNAYFNEVSCASAGNCTAVGQFKNAAGDDEAFTQTSTDGVWATARPASFGTGVQNGDPYASLDSVSCVSAGNCTAVGYFLNAAGGSEAFTQTSTGGVWGTARPASFASGVQNSNPEGWLTSVSCVSAGNCTAVGRFKNAAGYKEAFTQTSTGGVWATARPASFASGVQNSNPNAIFEAVSCVSAGNCTAVGYFSNPAGRIEAFTQTSTGGVWADGQPASFASGVQSASPSAGLNSVSCVSAGNCTAVGYFRNAAGQYEAFTQSSTGGVWATARPASFATGVQNAITDAFLTSVSCVSAGNCTAAGQFRNAAGRIEAFTQTSTDGVWADGQPASFASGVQYTNSNSYFMSVSCVSAGNCSAAGSFRNAAGGYEAFTQTATAPVAPTPTTVAPTPTTVAPPSLPETGSDGRVNVLIGLSLLLLGFGLRAWRRLSL
ncbi:MAG: LPXTG cell wall anchor domain-containing protein [Actinomycetota bacterium]